MADLLDRQSVIDVVHKSIFEFFDICDDNSEEPINEKDKLLLEVNKAICNSIKDLPSAQPERKKGKWIDYDIDNDKYDDVCCSECGKTFTVDAERWYDIGFTASDMKFCPNCGAKMEGE